MVGVYIPPGRGRTFFEERLDLIEGAIREHAPSPIIVAGDFNAHSRAWGSRQTDLRGRILEGWAVVRITSTERRLHEYMYKAAGGVGGRFDLGHRSCCGQSNKMASDRGAHGHGSPVHRGGSRELPGPDAQAPSSPTATMSAK